MPRQKLLVGGRGVVRRADHPVRLDDITDYLDVKGPVARVVEDKYCGDRRLREVYGLEDGGYDQSV